MRSAHSAVIRYAYPANGQLPATEDGRARPGSTQASLSTILLSCTPRARLLGKMAQEEGGGDRLDRTERLVLCKSGPLVGPVHLQD